MPNITRRIRMFAIVILFTTTFAGTLGASSTAGSEDIGSNTVNTGYCGHNWSGAWFPRDEFRKHWDQQGSHYHLIMHWDASHGDLERGVPGMYETLWCPDGG